MLAKRHKQLASLKTQAACRLHAVLAALVPGGLGKEMVPRQASELLRRVRPATMVEAERKRIAHQLLAEVRRLETELAAYNGTAPIEASSGARKRHRLNPRGNRMLNHALHLIAITQLRYPTTEGRRFYERKLAEGKTKKEAIRALKRRLSDVVYRHLQADQQQR